MCFDVHMAWYPCAWGMWHEVHIQAPMYRCACDPIPGIFSEFSLLKWPTSIPLSILPLQACAMADLAHLGAPFLSPDDQQPLLAYRGIPWLTLIASPFSSLLPSWPKHALREFCLLHGGSRSPSPTWSYYLHYIISENFWDNAFSYILIYFCYKILLTKKMKNDTFQRWLFS
jgi:hypothetical protein